MSAWRWYELGRFRILAAPLPNNPAFTTHRIFLGEKYIASQFSVPSLQQCEDRLSETVLRAAAVPLPVWKGWTTTQRKRGRKRKADAALELEEAIASD